LLLSEEGHKKKKAKKTKVHVLPSFKTYILTVPSLPGLPISNPQTFRTTITSKPSEQNGFVIRNPAAQVNTASSTPKTAPTFPSAIVILIHGGQQWYTFIAVLHSSSTNPYSSLLSSRVRSLHLSRHHQITNYSGTCLPTNSGSSAHYLNIDFKLKIPIHPLLQSSISTSHPSSCSCFALSLQHLCQPTSLRPVPTARRSLALGRSFSVGHGSLGASPLDPLVHMFNPSPYTHVKSQLPCSISLYFLFFSNSRNKKYK